MAYFPDLSPYEHGRFWTETMVTIGWLSPGYHFQKGLISKEVTSRIKRLCEDAVDHALGFHRCEFCDNAISNAVIMVQGIGKIYVAPDMLYHYIQEHHYLPPDEFIDAVLQTTFADGRTAPVKRTHKYEKYQLQTGYLTVAQIIQQYKHPNIKQDDRWTEMLTDTKYNRIIMNSKMGDTPSRLMIELLADPKYDRNTE